MRKHVLAVIDLQQEFLERLELRLSRDSIKLLCSNANKVIKHALEKDVVVMAVEYEAWGGREYESTSKAVISSRMKEKVHTVRKRRDSGAYEIQEKLQNLGITPESLTLIGINRAYCVARTGFGLSEIYKMPIYTIDEACECHLNYDSFGDLRLCDHFNIETRNGANTHMVPWVQGLNLKQVSELSLA